MQAEDAQQIAADVTPALAELTVTRICAAQVVAGDNDRTSFDSVALQQLADSIAASGLAQPITMRPIAGGLYQIVAGERRFRATQLLGWETVPAMVREMSDEQAADIMFCENIHRVDLNPMDEARAYSKRMQQFGWSTAEVACRAKVTAQRVRSRLTLLELIEDVQLLVKSGQLALGYAEAMTDLDHNRQVIAVRYFSEAKRPNLTEFKRLCGELLSEQAQECLFNFDEFMTEANTAEEEAHESHRIATNKSLPAFTGAVSVGLAMERYIALLVETSNTSAAEVVGTVYDGLIRANLAKPPKDSPLKSVTQ
jgi:ParB/RepB/Spo0J family partition protein